jgi:hypothetical protein
MVQKINGAAYPGVWVEKDTAFVRVTFGEQMNAIVAADLTTLDGLAVTTVVADSTFAVVESAIVQALKYVQSKATVLAVSSYDISSFSFDVFLGSAEGFFSDNAGAIVATGSPIALTGTVQAKVTTAGTVTSTGAAIAVGDIVKLNLTNLGATASFSMQFLSFTGGLPVATVAAGTLASGPGSTPGSTATPNGALINSANSYTPVTPLTVA